MTTTRKFTVIVPTNRIVRFPPDFPLGRVTVRVECDRDREASRAQQHAARLAIWGSMPELESFFHAESDRSTYNKKQPLEDRPDLTLDD